MWVSRASPPRSRGGESVVGISSVVEHPPGRAFGLSHVVGERRWRDRYGGVKICLQGNISLRFHKVGFVFSRGLFFKCFRNEN